MSTEPAAAPCGRPAVRESRHRLHRCEPSGDVANHLGIEPPTKVLRHGHEHAASCRTYTFGAFSPMFFARIAVCRRSSELVPGPRTLHRSCTFMANRRSGCALRRRARGFNGMNFPTGARGEYVLAQCKINAQPHCHDRRSRRHLTTVGCADNRGVLLLTVAGGGPRPGRSSRPRRFWDFFATPPALVLIFLGGCRENVI